MTTFDPRITPIREDPAAAHLRGQVAAPRYAEGRLVRIAADAAPLRGKPDAASSFLTEALFGEEATIYDETDTWAWGQLKKDGYVGWLPVEALSAPTTAPTHRVAVLRTFVFPAPSIKTPPLHTLSMGVELAVTAEEGAFAVLATGGWAITRHLAPLGEVRTDAVSVAEQFIGVPYLWGGKTGLGLDCSGLVQVSLDACGIAAPRDSDQQEAALGETVENWRHETLQRGDLIFWKGHVAMARGDGTMIHANAHHMMVAVEPVAEALARIEAAGSPVTSVRRLALPSPQRRLGSSTI